MFTEQGLWKKCPFSKKGVCTACGTLKISCDGMKYILCEQYKIVTSRDTGKNGGE